MNLLDLKEELLRRILCILLIKMCMFDKFKNRRFEHLAGESQDLTLHLVMRIVITLLKAFEV